MTATAPQHSLFYFLGVAVVYLAILVIYAIPSCIIYWKLYRKAGHTGWSAIVPLYSQYVMGVIAGSPVLGLIAGVTWLIYAVTRPIVTIQPNIVVNTVGGVAFVIWLVLGLVVLSKFIQKYDAGIGKWILFIFLPLLGVFFADSVKLKSSIEGVATNDPQVPDPTNKQRSAHVVLVSVLFVIILGALGFVFWQNIQNESSQLVSPDRNTTGTLTPNGWKGYTSKKYGVSFVVPNRWTVEETTVTTQNNSQTNPRYEISVLRPGNPPISDFSVTIFENNLDTFVTAERAFLQRIYAPPFKSTVSTLRWNEYDARRIYVDPQSATATDPTAKYHILLVQVGKFVYEIPDTEDPHRSVLNGEISHTDWQAIGASIRISG